MPSWCWAYGASSGSFCCWPLHTYTYEVDTAALLRSSAWSTVHAREVRCATNRWRDPGRRAAFPFRIPKEQSVPGSILFCAVHVCTHCAGRRPVPLRPVAWPVSGLRRNGSSATTEQGQPCQCMHASILFLDGSKLFVLAPGVVSPSILPCTAVDPKSNGTSRRD
jgi:hypothetical protein